MKKSVEELTDRITYLRSSFMSDYDHINLNEYVAQKLIDEGWRKTNCKDRVVELLEKQLAFWKSQTISLIKALEESEEREKCLAELLDKTEEELNGEKEHEK